MICQYMKELTNNNLFIVCVSCKRYQPFYWVRSKKMGGECYDCKTSTTSNMSRIANSFYVRSCDPDLSKKVKAQIEITTQQYNKRPEVRISNNIRKRLRTLTQHDNNHNTPETIQLIGCSQKELKSHIENQFLPGMTWDNYGNKENQWSIDHIIPLSAFDVFNTNQLNKANHYTNLRPLWHVDNMKKGSKIICN